MLDYIHIQLHVTMYYANNLEYYTNLSISTVITILNCNSFSVYTGRALLDVVCL